MKHTVVIPTYNAREFIVRALESVRRQTLAAAQIIVIDDGSDDDTPGIVSAWAQEKSVPVIQEQIASAGAGAARNRALELAVADWISFLDADDEWAPEKLERLDTTVSDDSHVEFVHTDRRYVLPSGETVDSGFRADSMVLREYLCSGFTMKTSTISIARKFFERTGLEFGTERTSEDYSLFWRTVIRANEIRYIDSALTIVHERQGSLTRSDNKSALLLDNIGVLASIIDTEPTTTPAAKKAVRALRKFRYRLSQRVLLVDSLSLRRMVTSSRYLSKSLGYGEFIKVLASVAVALNRRQRKAAKT